jgi:D-erythronate 2-dehydrogenase
MRIVITGGFGFVGVQLAAELLRRGSFRGRPLTDLVLADRFVRDGLPVTLDRRVSVVEGDLLDSLDELFAEPVGAVFHLASAVSAEAEADFDLGMRANLETTSALLAAARRQGEAAGPVPLVVFSSSVAVYGSDAALPLRSPVTEATLPTPQSSYGTQKYVCEQLIADYTRKGFIDGRVTRLMTVAVRPGRPNAAASGFLSGIVREPLAGIPATCPVSPELRVALASPRATVEGILRVAEAPRGSRPGELTGRLPVNLPALTVTVAEIMSTVRRVAGDDVADLVTFAPDPAVEDIVGSWPSQFDNSRASTLGLHADSDFESVVLQYVADHRDDVAPGTLTVIETALHRS